MLIELAKQSFVEKVHIMCEVFVTYSCMRNLKVDRVKKRDVFDRS